MASFISIKKSQKKNLVLKKKSSSHSPRPPAGGGPRFSAADHHSRPGYSLLYLAEGMGSSTSS
jgi:hypothetical protein